MNSAKESIEDSNGHFQETNESENSGLILKKPELPSKSNLLPIKVAKTLTLLAALILFFLLKRSWVRGIGSVDDKTCILDRAYLIFNDINYVMRKPKNVYLKNAIMIISSGLIDLLFLTCVTIW
jgi:hypothetical protein